MTKTIKANEKQIAIAKNTIEAFDNATSSIDTAIAAGLEMGKVLAAITKRATVDGKLSLSLLDSGLVSLGLKSKAISGLMKNAILVFLKMIDHFAKSFLKIKRP